MTYTLTIDKAALVRFQKLPKPIQQTLIAKAQGLKSNRRAGEPLKGKHRLLRSLHLTIEGTAYSIIYQVFDRSEMIVIRLAVSRTKLYRYLTAMKVTP